MIISFFLKGEKYVTGSNVKTNCLLYLITVIVLSQSDLKL